MTFSADSRWLATRDVAGQVRVWNPVNGELAKLIQLKSRADNRSTRGFAFSANHLASVDYSRIRVWEAATWREASWPASSVHPLGPFQELRFNHDGSLLVVRSFSEVSVWRVADLVRMATLKSAGHSTALALSATGHRLASANQAGETQVWDTDKWELLFTTRHTKAVNAITFSPDGRRFATASDDDTAAVWSADDGTREAVVDHGGRVVAVEFDVDERRLITASEDGSVRLWDLTSTHGVRLGSEPSASAVFTPTDLVVEFEDRSLGRWPMGAAAPLPIDRPMHLSSMSLSPNGQRVALAGVNDVVLVRDVSSGHTIAELRHPGRSIGKSSIGESAIPTALPNPELNDGRKPRSKAG